MTKRSILDASTKRIWCRFTLALERLASIPAQGRLLVQQFFQTFLGRFIIEQFNRTVRVDHAGTAVVPGQATFRPLVDPYA